METAKAAVEVPSPFAGVVHELHHAAGEVVDVGAPIITIDTDPSAGPLEVAAGSAAAGAAANPVESAAPKEASAVGSRAEVTADVVPAEATGALIGETAANGRTATLVGYGPRAGAATRRARVASRPGRPGDGAPPPPATAARVSAAAVGQAAQRKAGAVAVLAKPPVRKLARDLGVDLGALQGTGVRGTITRADVEAAAGPTAGGWRPGLGQRQPSSPRSRRTTRRPASGGSPSRGCARRPRRPWSGRRSPRRTSPSSSRSTSRRRWSCWAG